MAIITFPSDLDKQNSSYMVLTPYAFNVTQVENQNAKIKVNNKPSYYLPAPESGLTESESQSWEAQERADLPFSFKLDNLIEIAKAYKDKIVQEGQPDMIQRSLERNSGKVLNDMSALFFNGSDFRNFSFSWTLVPKSSEDSKILKSMLNDIKNYSRAGKISSSFLSYPYFWKIKIFTSNVNGESIELFKFANCVITDISIDYNPDSQMKILSDGNPLKYALSISFKELSKQYRG